MKINLRLKLIFLSILVITSLAISTNLVLADENNNNVNEENKEQTTDVNVQQYVISGMFDIKMTEGSYKFSQENNEIYLPFVRYASDRITIDKEISKMGLIYTPKTIDVNSKTNGIQILFSNDSIRVNNEMEYPIIYSNGDVVIDSNIAKSAIVLASGTITLTENSTINEDLLVFGGTLDIKGKVKGSVISTVENLKLSGSIDRDLRVIANNMELTQDSNIIGKIYIKTYNKDLKLIDKYKDVNINFAEIKNVNIWTQIVNIMIYAMIFTLLYVILDKITKKQMGNNMLNKTKAYPTFVILSGSLLLLAVPIIIPLLLILMVFKLWIISIPILLIYITYLAIVIILANFIVGSVIYKYISEKYSKYINGAYGLISLFVIYICLFALCKIPAIGMYIQLSLYIISSGIVFTTIFRKINKIDTTEKK